MVRMKRGCRPLCKHVSCCVALLMPCTNVGVQASERWLAPLAEFSVPDARPSEHGALYAGVLQVLSLLPLFHTSPCGEAAY
jgi:hypothetical protein